MFDNDPRVAKKKQSIIDVGQRMNLDITQGEIRRNKQILTNLRLETKQLKLALQQASRGQRNTDSDAHSRREEEQLHNKLCILKRSLNSVKGKKEELTLEIERILEETNFTLAEGNTEIDKDSAIGQKIRALENRLDKCLIKHNEVNTIRQTYESLLERLQQEQSGFDTQLAAMEKTLQNKERDLVDLNGVAADAAKGRDAAKSEVAQLKIQIAKEMREQRKDIEERKAFLDSKREQLERRHKKLLDKMARDEEKRVRSQQQTLNSQGRKRAAAQRKQLQSQMLTEEDIQMHARQREIYNHLKDLTSATNVHEVITKISERQDANAQLLQTLEAAELTHAALRKERAELQAKWDAVQQANGGIAKSVEAGATATGTAGTGTVGGGGSPTVELPAPGGSFGADQDTPVAKRAALVRRRVLEEFDAHLCSRRAELEAAQLAQEELGQLFVSVDAGVRHLAEKIGVTDGSGAAGGFEESQASVWRVDRNDTAPAVRGYAIVERLRACQAKLQLMMEDIAEADVSAAARTIEKWHGVMPEGNVRVRIDRGESQEAEQHNELNGESESDSERVDDGDMAFARRKWLGRDATTAELPVEDFPENEIHDRHELKMMSIATVDRERKKAKKMLMQRSKEENM